MSSTADDFCAYELHMNCTDIVRIPANIARHFVKCKSFIMEVSSTVSRERRETISDVHLISLNRFTGGRERPSQTPKFSPFPLHPYSTSLAERNCFFIQGKRNESLLSLLCRIAPTLATSRTFAPAELSTPATAVLKSRLNVAR